MSSVEGMKGEVIELRDCECGHEPVYRSNGIAHRVVCPFCEGTTDMEQCGYDAVSAWNNRK